MRLYFLVVQFIPFTTVSIQYYYNNAFFHKIGFKKDNETLIITHIIVVGFSQWQSVKTVACARLAEMKCIDDFIGWNQIRICCYRPPFWCRKLNDVNKENGWHENTNISNFGILIQENGKSDLQNSFLYGSLKDRCIQEKYFKCKKPIGWFYMEPPTCGRYWIVPGRTLSKKANCHGLKSIYEPDMLFITSFWKYWTLENCLITFLKNVTG